MEQEFTVLTPDQVGAEWSAIRPLLEKAVASGEAECGVDDVLQLVFDGLMVVLALREDGLITLVVTAEVVEYPKKRVLHVVYAGGKGMSAHAGPINAELTKVANKLDATTMQCMCKGPQTRLFKRIFPNAYEAYTVLRQEVTQ